jgi:hypothetical protein
MDQRGLGGQGGKEEAQGGRRRWDGTPKVRGMAVVPHDLADYDRKEARRDSDD